MLDVIKMACPDECAFLSCYGTLFEPAARHLGDLFRNDFCSEVDVTIGLCRLQTMIRSLSAGTPPLYHANRSTPAVLVAPQPKELHSFASFLDAEALWNNGWFPQIAYPSSDQELQEMLSARRIDALDLSLSTAFDREHWLPCMNKTIAAARRASRNPNLLVVVSGRIFAERKDAYPRVGADAGSARALHLVQTLKRSLVDRSLSPSSLAA